jgi:hypothetical protein
MPFSQQARRMDPRPKINVHDEYELRYWMRRLGCSAGTLHAAVWAVGTDSDAVLQLVCNAQPEGNVPEVLVR